MTGKSFRPTKSKKKVKISTVPHYSFVPTTWELKTNKSSFSHGVFTNIRPQTHKSEKDHRKKNTHTHTRDFLSQLYSRPENNIWFRDLIFSSTLLSNEFTVEKNKNKSRCDALVEMVPVTHFGNAPFCVLQFVTTTYFFTKENWWVSSSVRTMNCDRSQECNMSVR